MRYEIAQALRTGNRADNQDRIGCVQDGDNLIMVLADGMGGHAGGDIAAEILVETASDHFREAVKPIIDPHEFIRDIIHHAHDAMVHTSEDMPSRSPCTTGVVCLVQDGIAWWGHVGDSRLYILRDHRVVLQTRDHSFVEELIEKGQLSAADKASHPMRHYVTLCIGGKREPPAITLGGGDILLDGDIVLLCSDGLWGGVDDAFITERLESSNIGESLSDLAYQAEQNAYPNSDNISALALSWLGNSAPVKTSDAAAAKWQGDKQELHSAIEDVHEAITEFKDEMDK
jgi:serine/threonine protein phosphatase PrpC